MGKMNVTVTQTMGSQIIERKVQDVVIRPLNLGERQMLDANDAQTSVLTDNMTLTDLSSVIQFVDPGGSNRNVALPTPDEDNHGFYIRNIGDNGEILTVKSGATVVGYVGNGAIGLFLSDKTEWVAAYLGSATTNMDVQGRLTLETGVAISTADQSAKATLYFTPYKGNRISLYNGSAWVENTFTELSLSLAALSDATNYDVFIYNNNGTLTLSATAWTNATTRATALVSQDGILVKSGATTYRYLGTIRTSAAGQTSDTLLKRFVWNYYNRVERLLFIHDTTSSWTYNDTDWRKYNNSAANAVGMVIGVNEEPVLLQFSANAIPTSPAYASVGIGLDSVSAYSTLGSVATISPAGLIQLIARFYNFVGVGYHYLQLLERSRDTTNTTFYGQNTTVTSEAQSSASGYVRG